MERLVKKSSLIVLLILVVSNCFAQSNTDSLRLIAAFDKLNVALEKGDKQILKRLLHKKLTYAHSNGWIEKKKDLISALRQRKFVYRKIDLQLVSATINDNIGVVKSNAVFYITMNNKEQDYKLNVLQVWRRKKNKWQLMSRQSVQAIK